MNLEVDAMQAHCNAAEYSALVANSVPVTLSILRVQRLTSCLTGHQCKRFSEAERGSSALQAVHRESVHHDFNTSFRQQASALGL